MKIVIAEGTPIVPSRARDSITDQADFYMSIAIGSHYPPGTPTTITVRRHGRIESEAVFPGPQAARFGIRRISSLPRVYLHYFRLVRRALDEHPEARESCLIARFWFACLVGIWARRRGLVGRLVYWINDFYDVSGNAESRLVSGLFVRLQKYCVRGADEVWYLTDRMMAAHADASGKRWTDRTEKLVPVAFDSTPAVHDLWNTSDPHRFVYVGMMYMAQGLEIILPALKKVCDSIPDIKMDVVGAGPSLETFRELAAELGIAGLVTFHGFVEDEDRVREIVGRSNAGFALFDKRAENHTRYTLTGKIFMYVGCGVPVIVTESAGSFDYVMKGGAGLQVEYNVESVADGMRKMCLDGGLRDRLGESAKRLAHGFKDDALRLHETMTAACAIRGGREG